MTAFPLNPDPVQHSSPQQPASPSSQHALPPFKALACVAPDEAGPHAAVQCAARFLTRRPAGGAAARGAPGRLHLVTVTPTVAARGRAAAAPGDGPPLSSAGALAALKQQIERERVGGLAAAREALTAAQTEASGAGLPQPVPATAIPSAGARAGGVAAALAAYAAHGRFDLVVLGRRALTPTARALGPLAGLGSVSDAVLHSAAIPAVALAAARPAPARPCAPSTVAVAVDGSPGSDAALAWAVAHALGPGDSLALLAAARAPPLPVGPADAGGAAAEAVAWADQRDDAVAAADACLAAAAVCAEDAGVPPDRITERVLVPRGGGASLAVAAVVAGLAVAGGGHGGGAPATSLIVGSRGLGAVARLGLGLVGLGSCSTYVAHHARDVDVVVVKSHNF